jgi:monoamine oxidase
MAAMHVRTPSRPLTRRGFLHQLGAIGGSSLVMTAMSSWDLMAGAAGQRPALTGRPEGKRVLVLGAGLSGLVVGYELGKLGYDYRVLEARDRVGGLQWAVRRGAEHTEVGGERQVCAFDEGQYINAGPWRIPHSHTGVLNYCSELGVPVEVFLNESDASYFFYEGTAAGSLSNQRVRLREVKADMAGEINELLIKAIDQQQLDLALSPEDQKRLTDFLVNQGYLDASTRTYKAFANRGEGDPYQLTALRGRVRQPAALGACDGRYDGGADVPAGRGHGSDCQGVPAGDGRRPHHVQRRDPVGAPGRLRSEGGVPRHPDA